MIWTAAFIAALALWGWRGVVFDVVLEPLQLASAYTVPRGLNGCTFHVDPATATERTAIHEAGHCAGYILWGTAPGAPGDPHHSHNPASVMYSGGSSLDILPEDFAFARVTWMQWLRKSPRFAQVVVPGLAK